MTPTVHTESTRAGLIALRDAIYQAAALTLRAAEAAAVDSAKHTTQFHDKTGETRGSVRAVGRGLRGFVEARGAAHFLEYGTRPHIIRGNPILRFTVGGQTMYRRWVRHPGVRERPFMHEARERAVIAAEWAAEMYVGFAIGHARA